MKTLKLLLAMLAVVIIWLPGESAGAERVPAMREPIYRQLGSARDQVDKGDHDKALRTLDELRGRQLNSYETAMLWNLYAFVHYSRENYPDALAAYRKVLEQRPIPESLEQAALYSLAQLLVVTEDYAGALEALREWFARVTEPNAGAVMLLGQVHYQLGNYDQAREAVERAVRDAKARNQRVRENWYLMLRAIYYAQKDYPALADVLAVLVHEYPRREYWMQLAAVFGELGDEKRQLAALETAYEQNLFEQENDYVMLAQLLLANGVPFKAGKVLEQGIARGVVEKRPENLRMLADAWILAKEYDQGTAILREAATLRDDGELDLKLAQILLEMNRNREALEAARRAAEKGGLAEPEHVHIVIGLSLYNLERLDEASEAFARAVRYEEGAGTARQWLEFIDRERTRRAALDRALNTSMRSTEASSAS